ncbi:methyltransferase [Sphaerisporangium sp. TRM90804]|uniref:class I SAM-dependent methyltransferase n=1 Tax=Sphaerisporangium sp. TRM90804 TaxID=3031113 RepID=UPI00244C3ACF|nr:methyltransferase [Sphaerisporangium sp. TRM90804]MDH2429186.1 methyltransferase domain-containing protein [Sphaerisporangium sp. TRM90804]
MDPAKVVELMDRVMRDMGGAMTGLLCAIGGRLGLFRELAASGPSTSAELAARTELDERHVREWLLGLTAAGYLEADRASGRFVLPPALAMVVAAEGSPFDLSAGYQLIPALAGMVGDVCESFVTGEGVAQDRYPAELYQAMEEMSASWFDTMLVQQWIPAIDGLPARLQRGGRVADIGCGHGRALIACARAFPESRFVGFDAYGPNVEEAREAAEEAGVADRVTFKRRDATGGLRGTFDLVTAFSVLHDAPEPLPLLRAVHRAVAPDGVFLLLESAAADDPVDNAGPSATVLYGTSLLYCLPASLAEGGPGLGTLGLPPARIREYCGQAGFRSIRALPSANPFNALYEIRP